MTGSYSFASVRRLEICLSKPFVRCRCWSVTGSLASLVRQVVELRSYRWRFFVRLTRLVGARPIASLLARTPPALWKPSPAPTAAIIAEEKDPLNGGYFEEWYAVDTRSSGRYGRRSE
jgi:hypothetical protein